MAATPSNCTLKNSVKGFEGPKPIQTILLMVQKSGISCDVENCCALPTSTCLAGFLPSSHSHPRCSSCSSQRSRPGRSGTSFATAKVLMLQDTVIMTTLVTPRLNRLSTLRENAMPWNIFKQAWKNKEQIRTSCKATHEFHVCNSRLFVILVETIPYSFLNVARFHNMCVIFDQSSKKTIPAITWNNHTSMLDKSQVLPQQHLLSSWHLWMHSKLRMVPTSSSQSFGA